MKQLTMFIALNTDGGDRVTYYYDTIDQETGSIIGSQKKEHFFVLDSVLKEHINKIRVYIRTRIENPLYQLTSFMSIHIDNSDRIGFTFDKIDPTGRILSTGNKDGFVVLDEGLKKEITAIREWLTINKLQDE